MIGAKNTRSKGFVGALQYGKAKVTQQICEMHKQLNRDDTANCHLPVGQAN